jgi:hypothetical protein
MIVQPGMMSREQAQAAQRFSRFAVNGYVVPMGFPPSEFFAQLSRRGIGGVGLTPDLHHSWWHADLRR